MASDVQYASSYKRGEWKKKLRLREACEATATFSHNAEFPLDAPTTKARADALQLCGLGHPLLDITAVVPESFLTKYRVERGVPSLATDEQVDLFPELSAFKDVRYVPGGAAMNTIRVARWMLGSSCDSLACRFIGAIGNDDFGQKLRAELEKAQIEPVFHVASSSTTRDVDGKAKVVSEAGPPTGTCGVLVVDKERSMVTNLGAAREVPQSFLHSQAVQTAINESDVFYMEGFFFNIISNPETHRNIASVTSASPNKIFVANISAPFLCYSYKSEWKDLIPALDVLIGNEVDWMAFAPVVLGWEDGMALETVASRTASLPINRPEHHPLGGRAVIITRGTKPTIVAYHDQKQLKVRLFKVPLVDPDKVVDDCGAGDSFAGGFLAGLALHKPLPACIHAGMYAAGITVQAVGCSVPAETDFDWDTVPTDDGDSCEAAEWLHKMW